MITYMQQLVAYLPPKHILIVDFDNVDIEVMLESYGCKSKPNKSNLKLKQGRLSTWVCSDMCNLLDYKSAKGVHMDICLLVCLLCSVVCPLITSPSAPLPLSHPA